MAKEELIKVLDQQTQFLKSMHATAKAKQVALIKRNFEELNINMKQEERLIKSIRDMEKRRVSVMTELNKSFGFKLDDYKIAVFIENMNGNLTEEEVTKLKEQEQAIHTYTEEITRVNRQNSLLIQQSKQFITDTINSLVGDEKKSILDRKV